MKTMPFIISKMAVADLEEIWRYAAAKWSVDHANRYYNLILDEISYVCEHGSASNSISWIRLGYRLSKIKSHLIFFKPSTGTPEVIRILHENNYWRY